MGRGERFPASYYQQWLYEASEGQGSSFNVPIALKLRGAIAIETVRAALDALGTLHPVLTTRFVDTAAGVEQYLSGQALTVIEAEGAEPLARAPEQVMAAVDAEVARPFVLAGGPLARVALFRLGDAEHLLTLTAHHAIVDGWSRGVLADDLAELLGAEAAMTGSPESGFGEYARSERRFSDAAKVEYWRARLATSRAGLAVPVQSGCDAGGVGFSTRGRGLGRLGRDVRDRLERVAQDARTTLARVLAAAAITSVRRYVSSPLTFMMTTANRRGRPELQRVVGCVAGEVPVIVDLAGDPSFTQVARRVDEALTESFKHQVPLGLLEGMLRAGSHRAPLVDVSFNYLLPWASAAQESRRCVGGLEITEVDVAGAGSAGGVSWMAGWWVPAPLIEYQVGPDDGGLRGQVVGNELAVTSATVRRLAAMFVEVLQRASAEPQCAVGDLAPMLDVDAADGRPSA